MLSKSKRDQGDKMKKWVYATILVLIIPLIALGSFEWGDTFWQLK